MPTLVNVLFELTEEEPKTEIIAKNNKSAFVIIRENDLEKAYLSLLAEKENITAALRDWKEDIQNLEPVEKEEPKEKKPQKHYRVARYAIEDIQADIDEYTSTPRGAKFVKSLETAKEFCYKNSNGGMACSEISYFFDLAVLGKEWDAISDAYNVAYRRGYNKAKRDLKKKERH